MPKLPTAASPDAIAAVLGDTTTASPSPLAVARGDMSGRMLPIKEVCRLTSYSRPSLYRLVQQGKFPQPLKLTENGRVAFREHEVNAWLASRSRAFWSGAAEEQTPNRAATAA